MTQPENNSLATPGSLVPAPAEPSPVDVAGGPSPEPVAEDLRISWSWLHMTLLVVFGVGSLFLLQAALATYLIALRGMSLKQVQGLLTASPAYVVALQGIWFFLMMLFLYVTLGVLRDAPYWRTLGWRPLRPRTMSRPAMAALCFFGGLALATFVSVAGARFQPQGKMPIQELFKDRTGALLVMGLAVFAAPLVEETLFRGYLYPLLARKMGIRPAILLTGFVFGLLHGGQLGWTWGLVALLTLVGVIFTYVRARTGTVLASYLLHLGYNSTLAIAFAFATKGFQRFPLGN